MEENQVAANAAAAPTHFFKLPDFWTGSPAAWFSIVEAQFEMREVTSQRDKFALISAVLPEISARCVTHLLAGPPETSATTDSRLRCWRHTSLQHSRRRRSCCLASHLESAAPLTYWPKC